MTQSWPLPGDGERRDESDRVVRTYPTIRRTFERQQRQFDQNLDGLRSAATEAAALSWQLRELISDASFSDFQDIQESHQASLACDFIARAMRDLTMFCQDPTISNSTFVYENVPTLKADQLVRTVGNNASSFMQRQFHEVLFPIKHIQKLCYDDPEEALNYLYKRDINRLWSPNYHRTFGDQERIYEYHRNMHEKPGPEPFLRPIDRTSLKADALQDVNVANEKILEGQSELEQAVRNARSSEISWARIGRVLNLDASAAMRKFDAEARKRHSNARRNNSNKDE